MKDIDYYMSLPYNIIVKHMQDESEEYYYAKVKELDGCQSSGKTYGEAYENIKEAMREWLEIKLEQNVDIPVPKEN